MRRRALAATSLLLVLAGCGSNGGTDPSKALQPLAQPSADGVPDVALETATELADRLLGLWVSGQCRELVDLFYEPETPTEDVDATVRVCEESPLDGYELEPAVAEEGAWEEKYPGAVEVPFTFTRDGESEHDNVDVIFVDGKAWVVRD